MTNHKQKKKKKRAPTPAAAAALHSPVPCAPLRPPQAPIPNFDKIFESDPEEDEMARRARIQKTKPGEIVAKNDARIDRAVGEVLDREPEQWTNSAAALVGYVHKQRKGEKKLEGKLLGAADKKSAEAARMADILARKPNFDPGPAFGDFKIRRFARLFLLKPEMVDHYETLAANAPWDKSFATKIKFYQDVGGDAQTFIDYMEDLCETADKTGKLYEDTQCTFRETLDAMDWFADNMYEDTCDLYDEYKEIPTKEMFIVHGQKSNLV